MTNEPLQVPEVTVDESYTRLDRYGHELHAGKYIVADIDGKRIVWADNAHAYEHKDLVVALEVRLGREVKCLGGGALHIAKDTRKIYIWDFSARYGHDDKRQTAEALKHAFPEYKIVRENPDLEQRYLREKELEEMEKRDKKK